MGVGAWARGSATAYPVANVLHLLGLVMLLGGIAIVDLRIVGLWQKLPLMPLAQALIPVALGGLVLLLTTGVILFAADGKALAGSPTFQWKLCAILLALANALLFRWRWRPAIASGRPQLAARIAAALSLMLWLSVGWLGRMIAYS